MYAILSRWCSLGEIARLSELEEDLKRSKGAEFVTYASPSNLQPLLSRLSALFVLFNIRYLVSHERLDRLLTSQS